MADGPKLQRTRLSADRETELADLAEAVAESHCPEQRIEPETIISRKRIALCYDHYEDAFDGMIEYDDGEFFIHCNLDRENTPGSTRARFTLAHELGHYFIDEHRNNLASGQVPPHPSFSDRCLADVLVEREADFFASRLLLPNSRFLAAAKRLPVGLSGIESVAHQFDVSLSCAAIRVVAAEVFPCVVIKWSSDGFGWKWCSKQFWNLDYRKTIERIDQLTKESATAECIAKDRPDGIVHETATTAAFWFPFVREREARNIILREQAISQGRFGVLTVLTLHDGRFPKEVEAIRARELGFAEGRGKR